MSKTMISCRKPRPSLSFSGLHTNTAYTSGGEPVARRVSIQQMLAAGAPPRAPLQIADPRFAVLAGYTADIDLRSRVPFH